jgi:hypothetical protein
MDTQSKRHINLLHKWIAKAGGHRWCHEQSHRHYKRVNNNFTYLTIIMSTITGIAGFALHNYEYAHTVIACMNILNGMLVSFSKFIRAAEKGQCHWNTSKQYEVFVRSFTLELNIYRDMNTDLVVLIKECRNEYEKVTSVAPSVPQHVIDQFILKFKMKDVEADGSESPKNKCGRSRTPSTTPDMCKPITGFSPCPSFVYGLNRDSSIDETRVSL